MIDEQYEMELAKARSEYKDLMERGVEAMGDDDELDELMKETMTEEEIRECKFKTMLLSYFMEYNKGKELDMDIFEEFSHNVFEELKSLASNATGQREFVTA
ncbi:MAG: hypothetical protein IKN43_01175 [Selenomonadaceae bacterium]|nr:hypothetical protein [Selenomonadaceae bacterium]